MQKPELHTNISGKTELHSNGSVNLEGPSAASVRFLVICARVAPQSVTFVFGKWTQIGDALLF